MAPNERAVAIRKLVTGEPLVFRMLAGAEHPAQHDWEVSTESFASWSNARSHRHPRRGVCDWRCRG